MSQLSSVERTTVIELFSTFFDRLSSNHPNREPMLKSLYQFKSLLYSDGNAVEKYLQEISSKSPLKRDNSQTKNSVRKTKVTFMTSCGHEVEKEAFDLYVQSQTHEVKCPVCCALLPVTDYRALTPFEEFKIKNASIFKCAAHFESDDLLKLISQLDETMSTSLGKQRCASSTGELFKDPMNHSRMTEQIIRKCLRCNKDVQNNDQKNISYFCNLCKNF